jgi:hypothetical protein
MDGRATSPPCESHRKKHFPRSARSPPPRLTVTTNRPPIPRMAELLLDKKFLMLHSATRKFHNNAGLVGQQGSRAREERGGRRRERGGGLEPWAWAAPPPTYTLYIHGAVDYGEGKACTGGHQHASEG